ncbi:hypothetical protein HBI47_197940 [Parastagonospora nodorum]|nr:hypothetical protein HBI47_197940 [Parastagonospora nodorum]KAH6395850.1 hypothetical protein HBI14_192000 [Parastagonospora nodorum]
MLADAALQIIVIITSLPCHLLHRTMKSLSWAALFSTVFHGVSLGQSGNKIFACPEQLGAEPQACQSDTCGNEDKSNPKHCSKKAPGGINCVCDPSRKPSGPAQTTKVVAQASATTGGVTGVYALATLAAFSNLREKITATITIPASQATGASTPEKVVPVVVYAGGVAWYLATVSGGEAAALTPPIEPAGHPNDNTCPAKKTACKDCGGKSGICVSPNTGCGCEQNSCPKDKPTCDDKKCKGDKGKCTFEALDGCECGSSCPTGDKKPKCKDTKCQGGSDNKCTVQNKGCECDQQKCPSEEDLPFCSDCGGEENDKSICGGHTPCCKQDAPEFEVIKGCGCYKPMREQSAPYTPPLDRKKIGQWRSNLQSREKEICQPRDDSHSEVLAPQHEKDGKPSVESAAKDWCSKVDGKTLGDTPEFQFNKYKFSTFWLSASLRKDAPANLKCGKDAKIKKDDCIKTIDTAMARCEPYQQFTHGASLAKGCIFYNVTLNGESNSGSPPWAPSQDKPSCDSKISDITNTFFKSLYPAFCKQIKNGAALKKTLTSADIKTSGSRKRTPPPSPKSFQGYKFNFEFIGGNSGCKKTCEEAYADLNSACGREGTTMKQKGQFDVGCGKYSYSIEQPPPKQPTTCKPRGSTKEDMRSLWRDPWAGYPKNTFQAASHQYCNGGWDWVGKVDKEWSTDNYFWIDSATINPKTNLPEYCMGAAIGDMSQWSPNPVNCKSRGMRGGNVKINLHIQPAVDQTGCKPLKDHKIPKGPECTKIFDAVADDCIKGAKNDGPGGYYLEKSDDGCWEWWIHGLDIRYAGASPPETFPLQEPVED